MSPKRKSFYLLNPFENGWHFPRILVNDSAKTIRKHSRYVISKTTAGDMGNSFYTSFAYYIKHLFQKHSKSNENEALPKFQHEKL